VKRGAAVVAIVHPWYNRRLWRDKLRPLVLSNHPLCTKCGERTLKPSTHADHIVPFKTGVNEQEQWNLFTDLKNLTGLCTECHSEKTATFDGGFGHRRLAANELGHEQTALCGDVAVKYVVSSFPDAIDRALAGKKVEQS
jgi:5-methylcytosine-specific restriction endonuclease McrA